MLNKAECEKFDHIISWQPHGRSFAVHQRARFVSDVLPRFFHQTVITSFQRQLNLYGFSRQKDGQDRGGYYHELFLRGHAYLCQRMRRTRLKGTGLNVASTLSTEPNFYDMDFCFEAIHGLIGKTDATSSGNNVPWNASTIFSDSCSQKNFEEKGGTWTPLPKIAQKAASPPIEVVAKSFSGDSQISNPFHHRTSNLTISNFYNIEPGTGMPLPSPEIEYCEDTASTATQAIVHSELNCPLSEMDDFQMSSTLSQLSEGYCDDVDNSLLGQEGLVMFFECQVPTNIDGDSVQEHQQNAEDSPYLDEYMISFEDWQLDLSEAQPLASFSGSVPWP